MGDEPRGINLKVLSITIFAFIVVIIVGIFLFMSKPLDKSEGNIKKLEKDLQTIQDENAVKATGSIYLPNSLRLDYIAKRNEGNEKITVNIFVDDMQSYTVEYYNNGELASLYIPAQEKTIKLEEGVINNITLFSLVKKSLKPDQLVTLEEEKGYRWQVSTDTIMTYLKDFLDPSIISLIQQASQSKKTDFTVDDALAYLKSFVKNDPVVIYEKMGQDQVNLEIIIKTVLGDIRIKESIENFNETIELPQ